MVSNIKLWMSAGRVKHYIKGIVIFSVFFLDFTLLTTSNLFKVVGLFFGFGFIASVVYILNDLYDSHADRSDNFVKNRPYASGVVSKRYMIMLALIFGFMGITSLSFLMYSNPNSIWMVLLIVTYFTINLIYSRYNLKKNKVLGMVIVGLGFPIRFLLGFLLLDTTIPYLFPFMIFLLAILIISGKRHYRELNNAQENEWVGIFSFILYANIIGFLIFLNLLLSLYEVKLIVLLVWPLFVGIILRFKHLVRHKRGWLDLSLIFIFDYVIFILAFVAILLFIYSYS